MYRDWGNSDTAAVIVEDFRFCQLIFAVLLSLFVFDLESGKTREVALPAGVRPALGSSMLSRDGSRIAVVEANGDVRILSVNTGDTLRQVPAAASGYSLIGWAGDGRHLFLYRLGDVPERVQRLDIDTAKMEVWKELTLEDLAGLIRIHPVILTPDGRSWAFSYTRVISDLYVVEGLT